MILLSSLKHKFFPHVELIFIYIDLALEFKTYYIA